MTTQDFTTQELANEIWKPIERFDSLYEISNLGRVKRLPKAFHYRPTEKILKPFLTENGYQRIGLRIEGGKQIKRYVHQLVTEAFIGKCPAAHEVNHIDGIKINNRIGNLEYLLPKANKKHALENSLYPSGNKHHYSVRPETIRKGESHPYHKLTEVQVLEIRQLLAESLPQKQIAKIYNVTKTTIYCIKYGKIWQHI